MGRFGGVVHVCCGRVWGGAEQAAMSIAAAGGHEVISNHQPGGAPVGVRHVQIQPGRPVWRNGPGLIELWRLLRTWRGIVHCHQVVNWNYAAAVTGRTVPKVLTVHTLYQGRQLRNALVQQASGGHTQVVFVSPAVEASWREALPCPRRLVIPPPVQLAMTPEMGAKPPTTQAGGPIRVVTIGRAALDLGFDRYAELASVLATSGKYEFLHAGPGGDALCETAGIRWLGVLAPSEAGALLGSADVVVFLQRKAAFGLAPAEAISLGKRVLSTPWGGESFFEGRFLRVEPYSLDTVVEVFRDIDQTFHGVDVRAGLPAALEPRNVLAEYQRLVYEPLLAS